MNPVQRAWPALLVTTLLAASAYAQEPPPGQGTPGPAPEASLSEGARIYLERCAACHGKEGRGDGKMAEMFPVPMPDFTDAERMRTQNDAALKEIISVGGGPLGRAPFMPGFGIALSENEINLVVEHLRTLAE